MSHWGPEASRGGAGELRQGAGDRQADDTGCLLQRRHRAAGTEWFDEALASYEKALVFKPHHTDAFNRGIALQELKRLDEALASYDKKRQHPKPPSMPMLSSGTATCQTLRSASHEWCRR